MDLGCEKVKLHEHLPLKYLISHHFLERSFDSEEKLITEKNVWTH